MYNPVQLDCLCCWCGCLIMKSVNYCGYIFYENGEIQSKRYNKRLKGFFRRDYLAIRFYNGETNVNRSIARLIAILFIPNPDNKPEVNHKNGIKTDNRADNLEWMTSSENTIHSYKNKLQVKIKGIEDKRSIQVIQYDKKWNFIAEYGSINEAQRITGINKTNISLVIHNKRKSAGKCIWIKK